MVSSLKLCTVYTFIFAWSAEWEICHPSRESQEARAGRQTDKGKTEKEIQSMTAGMGNKAEREGEHEWNLSVKTSPEWIRTWRQTVPLSALQNNKHSIPWLVCTQVSSALRAQTLHKTNMSRERCRLQRPTRTQKKRPSKTLLEVREQDLTTGKSVRSGERSQLIEVFNNDTFYKWHTKPSCHQDYNLSSPALRLIPLHRLIPRPSMAFLSSTQAQEIKEIKETSQQTLKRNTSHSFPL